MLLKCCYSLSPNCKSNLKLLSFYFRSWSNTNWGNKPSRSQNVYMDFHSFDWSLQRKPVTLRLSGKKQQRWWNDWAFAAAAVLDWTPDLTPSYSLCSFTRSYSVSVEDYLFSVAFNCLIVYICNAVFSHVSVCNVLFVVPLLVLLIICFLSLSVLFFALTVHRTLVDLWLLQYVLYNVWVELNQINDY